MISFVCDLTCDWSQKMFYVYLRKINILLPLGFIYVCQVHCVQKWFIVLFKVSVSLQICMDVLSIIELEILKSLTIVVLLFISPLSSVSTYFTYLFWFGVHVFINIYLFWLNPFVIMNVLLYLLWQFLT